jgi:uncharacterized protein
MKEIKNLTDWKDLLSSAEEGDTNHQLEVALYYDSGIYEGDEEIVAPDAALAFEWTKRAYESGSIDAMERYANYLSDGVQCTQDKALAMKLYKKAVKAGSSSAAHNLGTEYRDQHDFEKAFSLYKKGESDLSVALCYYYGVGVEQNRKRAFRVFRKMLKSTSIQSGYDVNEANYMIGRIYLEGEVVKRSLSKARHYLLLANEDGDHYSAQQILWIIGRE